MNTEQQPGCNISSNNNADQLADLNPDDFPEGKERDYEAMPSDPIDVSNSELNPDDFAEVTKQTQSR